MAQSVNVKFAKCFIIFMAVVILVQGIGYLGLSIWGVLLSDCGGNNSDPLNRPFEFVLDLVYFSSEKCGRPSLYIDAVGQTVEMNINFSVAEVLSNREFIFLIAYIVISALWIVTSFFVLVTICGPVTKLVAAVCFWPWFIVIMAGSVLDAVATGYHIHDILHTTSASDTFEYIGVEQNPIIMQYLQDYDIYFITPAVAFTCISSRVVLVWFLNIFGAIFCLSLSRVLAANNSMAKKEQQHRLPVDRAVPTQPPQRQISVEAQMQERTTPPYEKQDSVILRYQPTAPPVDPRSAPQSPQAESSPYPPLVIRPQSSTKNKRVSEIKTQASVTNDTYQSSDAHPANLDYPSRNGTVSSQQAELSPISPLNMRYSTPDGPAFPSQPHVTQELRGQLPWSYTNIMNDPIAQKRIQSHLQPDDDDDLPSIPAPDYTIHPSRKDRSQINPDRQSQSGYSRW